MEVIVCSRCAGRSSDPIIASAGQVALAGWLDFPGKSDMELVLWVASIAKEWEVPFVPTMNWVKTNLGLV